MRRAAATVMVGAALAMPATARGDGEIQDHFVGVSIEWSLIDRYMGPNARPGFANLLRNLGTGVLRIGGSSQDQVPFDATKPDSEEYVTPHDLAAIRATLDLAPDWVTVLGTAMAPPAAAFQWRGVDHARAFVRDGVVPAFGDEAGRRLMAGIALGNEPDLTYSANLERYLSDYLAYAGAEDVNQWPRLVPATSENIGTWQSIRDRTINTRWFWDWPTILDRIVGPVSDRVGVLGPFVTDHYYPLARTCASDPYRCPTIARLLSQERYDTFDYEVYTHAAEAARHGLSYRMDETNTAAGRGAPGVSDAAASATWTLETLFHAACPQPPDAVGANADCHLGATGVNVHNAEVRVYFKPEEGNAYYNAIRYDPTAAMGAPTAGPSYYALLLFARLAQGRTGLRPLALDGVRAWELRSEHGEPRLFLINPAAEPITVQVPVVGSIGEIDRMTPFDPSGAGRTLDAPEVRLDGRAVATDGSFPGLQPTAVEAADGRIPVTLAPGEVAVVTLHPSVAVAATVPATLSVSLGRPASFGAFIPGVDRTYEAATTATVTSTAGDATLAVTGGRLMNGTSALAEPLQVRGDGLFAPLGTAPVKSYGGPVSNDAFAVGFRQHIGPTEALRTGTYATTLTFALSTTAP